MGKKSTCYMCDKVATTREHVPPLSLFPEGKDVKWLNFRQNLITVPSCEEHNSKKSSDDEFLMVSIAGIIGNNELAYIHTQTKIDRSLRRKSRDFLSKAVMRNAKTIEINLGNGKKFPALIGNPDYWRLVKCFKYIASGLYFHEFGVKFEGKINVLFGFLKYEDENTNMMIKLAKTKIEVDEITGEEKGSNPDVFYYQFCEPDKFGLIALKLVLYGSTEVFISFKPKNARESFDLAIALINDGIQTRINLKGHVFDFNKKEQL